VIAFGVGLSTAAVLPESPAWRLPFHAFGATLAMAGGNLAIILTGLLGARLGIPARLARVLVVLGAVGLTAFVVVQVLALVDDPTLPHGMGALERVAAYPVLATQVVIGVSLLVEAVRLRRRSSEEHDHAVMIAA
jgi:hypothetical protein